MNRIAITVLIALHLAVVVRHGGAHTALAITLSPGNTAFVLIVILLAPLIGLALIWTRYAVAGTWIVVLSMAGALLFGVYHHYLTVSPDNIHHLPAGNAAVQSTFVRSAGALALLELGSLVVGAFLLRSLLRKARRHAS